MALYGSYRTDLPPCELAEAIEDLPATILLPSGGKFGESWRRGVTMDSHNKGTAVCEIFQNP